MMKPDSVLVNSLVRFSFNTKSFANGAATNFSDPLQTNDIKVYKDHSTTQRTSESGYTITTAFDSADGVVGINVGSLDLSDNADSGFYERGHYYTVVLDPDTETVDSEFITDILYTFWIEDPNNLSDYEGKVWFSSGVSNTNEVLGIDGKPRNQISGAVQVRNVSDRLGTRHIMIDGSITLGTLFQDYIFESQDLSAEVLGTSGILVGGSRFIRLDVSGDFNGDANTQFDDCRVFNITKDGTSGLKGILNNCKVFGSVISDDISDLIFNDCFFENLTLDCSNSAGTIKLNSCSGIVTIINVTASTIVEIFGRTNLSVIVGSGTTGGSIIFIGSGISSGAGFGTSIIKVGWQELPVSLVDANLISINGNTNADGGIAFEVVQDLIIAMSIGRFQHDTPVAGQTTLYHQDGTTPIAIVSTTTNQRNKISGPT